MQIGFHVSIVGGIDQAIDRAITLGCNVFQIFTRNPRAWAFHPLNQDEVKRFKEKLERYTLSPVFSHMPYLPNLASSRPNIHRLSIQSLTAELKRCSELGIPYLVTHLGSHLGAGKAQGFRRITDAINSSLSEDEGEVMLLLENTAGTSNSMGSSFQDIKRLLSRIVKSDRVGVCFDTCHAFAAGYDLRTMRLLNVIIESFDSTIGLERLKVVHLNDSKGGLRSHIDRHEHIGLGKIGETGFSNILHSKLGCFPLILETPIDERRTDVENLQKVRDLARSNFRSLT